MHVLCKCQSARSFCFISMGLKIIFHCLDTCHKEFNMNIHKSGMLRFATTDPQIVVRSSSSRPEVSVETVLLTENAFFILNKVWSIGITRRGLNKHIKKKRKFDHK